MIKGILFIVFIFEISKGVHTFKIPVVKGSFSSVPYGRPLRGILSGEIPAVGVGDIPRDLSWWQSLSRNNTLDCECGLFGQSSVVDPWNDEGVHSVNVYPWSVSLVAPGTNYAYCGGTLVNDRYVLTSASCVDGAGAEDVEVLVGSWPAAHFPNDTDPDELRNVSLFRKKVHRVILHPMYLDSYLDHNIALLRLKGPVPTFGNRGGISPVCLPPADPDYSEDGRKASSLLWRFNESYGFLTPTKRSEVESLILSQSDCRSYNYSEQWDTLPESVLCSKMEMPMAEDHPYKESWDCPGDAGGFLLVTEGHQKVLVALDSWTACFGRPKGIGLYTRLSQFLPWIHLHISKDGRHCAH